MKKRKAKIEPKKEKPLFPPEPTPSKVDLQLESGEYFLRQDERDAIKRKKKEVSGTGAVIITFMFEHL